MGTGLKPASLPLVGVGLTLRNVADDYHSQSCQGFYHYGPEKVVIKKLNAIQDLGYRYPLYG